MWHLFKLRKSNQSVGISNILIIIVIVIVIVIIVIIITIIITIIININIYISPISYIYIYMHILTDVSGRTPRGFRVLRVRASAGPAPEEVRAESALRV